MATVHSQRGKDDVAAKPTLERPQFADGAAAMELQREGALFVAQAGQIMLRSMEELARRQAEAVRGTMEGLAQVSNGAGDRGPLDAQQHFLRASVLGFLTQLQLGLETAATTSAATLALLEDKLAHPAGSSEHGPASSK
jgi:hypothetical protein